MNRIDIEQCNDTDALKDLAIRQYQALSCIGEICVDVSRWHITSDKAIKKIREYLCAKDHELSRQ